MMKPFRPKHWVGYKVLDESSGVLKYMMHGVEKDRKIKVGWNTAEKKQVTDGSGKRRYESGFHFFLGRDEAEKWLKLYPREGRVIKEVLVRGEIRKKHWSRLHSYLTSELAVIEMWNK